MEGKFRPNHLKVLWKWFIVCFLWLHLIMLFSVKKIFSKLWLCKTVSQLNLPVQIVKAPIIRESNGLAMSSNYITTGKIEAGFLFDVLKRYGHEKEKTEQLLIDHGFEVEYLEVHQFW